MENTRYNGLSGKARRARDLNRVTRMFAQQMIDEYLYPEPEARRPERYVPIRSRSEFLPTAASFSDESARAPKLQLELPLANVDAEVERPTGVKITDVPRRGPVVRPPRAPFQPTLWRKQKQSPFSPGGFLFGCALGSAAAAMVLLVVQLAVG